MPFVLTLVAPPGALSAEIVARVRDAAGAGPADWLSAGEAADLPCSSPPDTAALRQALAGAAVDTAVQALPGPGASRRKRLLIADMDSTIVTGETLDELAAYAGVGEQVAAITRASMNGELDFAQALRARVAMLRGLPLDALDSTWAGVSLSPGARALVATMRAHGAVTALVSGGFTFFTGRVAALCGFNLHRSNVLLDDGEVLLGTVQEPVVDRDAKRATLHELADTHGLPLADTMAVGDGANDLAMIRDAGLGVAYRAKPVVAAEARARVDHADLRALLFFQGYRRSEIVE